MPRRRFRHRLRQMKDQPRASLLSMSWIKRSSKVHSGKQRTKRACMRNGGSFPIASLTITTWWGRGPRPRGQRPTWKSAGDCVPITRCFTIACARKQVPRNSRATSTRTKRSIWCCWHKTAFALRLLPPLSPQPESRRKRTGLTHRNLNCERQNRLCRNSRRRRDVILALRFRCGECTRPRVVVSAREARALPGNTHLSAHAWVGRDSVEPLCLSQLPKLFLSELSA
jgi:hypothetical protein